MGSIREDFVGVVHVYAAGESVFLGAGDDVPEGVRVREDVLAGHEGDVEAVAPEPVSDDAAQVVVDDEGLPADSDSREAWNAYAESVGFDPSPYAKKESLIEALKQR